MHDHHHTTHPHTLCQLGRRGGSAQGIGNKVSRQWVSPKNCSHDISISSAHSIRSTRSTKY